MSEVVVCYLPGHEGRNIIDSKPPLTYWKYYCGCFPSPAKRFTTLILHKQIPLKDTASYVSFLDKNCVDNSIMFADYSDTDVMDEDVSYPTESSRQEIEKGVKLNVIDFLSNHGKTKLLVRSNGDFVPIDVVRKKYLLICCVALPLSTVFCDARCLRAMIDAHCELYGNNNFEMVVVANMKSGFSHSKAAFDHFFSAFPCLAIPFSDVETRNYICSSMGLNMALYTTDLSAIVVNSRGKILWGTKKTARLFYEYGCELYHFRDKDLEAIETQDYVLRMRLDPLYARLRVVESFPSDAMEDPLLQVPLSLYKDILLCDPNLVLKRCDPAGGAVKSVRKLSKKYVGLYLCYDGEIMEELHKVHEQCIANKQQLEIVVVFMALFDDTNSYEKDLRQALELCNIKSWFVFDYDPKVCRRLWRVFGKAEIADRLIIIPPNCKSGELEGKAVIAQMGSKEYPFTRSSIIERRVKALKSVNPVSWFKYIYKRDTNFHDKMVPRSELEGKKLLLYLDFFESPSRGKFRNLMIKHYPEIQAKGWEVVFVPLDYGNGPYLTEGLPWPIMPLPVAREFVSNQLIFKGECYCTHLISVGEDGMIRSNYCDERLEEYGVTESLFDDNLYEDMASQYAFIEDED